jgi:hypothetical protein
MTNHYHILVETPEGNLCVGMRHQNILGDEVFAQQYLPSPDEQQKLTEVPKD